MRAEYRVTVTLELPERAVLRTQLEPVHGFHQRVESPSTVASRGTTMVVEHQPGVRLTYVEADSGPLTLTSIATVRTSTPDHLRTRVPPIAWDQSAALTRAIRTTGTPGDGTRVPAVEAMYITATALPSRLVPVDDEARDLAFSTLNPGQPLIVAIAEIASKVAASGLDAEAAAHLLIGAMRSVGLASGYVLGTAPGIGIHPWVSIYIPGFTWFHIDPLTATPIDATHVMIGWGRDSSDVPLVRGADATVTAAVVEV